MKLCRKCGSKIPEQMNFCSMCGTKCEDMPAGRSCPVCGFLNEAASGFCSKCGRNMNEAADIRTPKASNYELKDFYALAFGILSIIFYQYYIGIGFGVVAIIFGNSQIKEGKKGLGIIGIAAAILGIIATIGVIIG